MLAQMPDPETTPEPRVILNPRSDSAFVGFVDEVRAEGVTEGAALQRRLRERYPDAVVRHREFRDERMMPDTQPIVQYVYRDGRWVGGRSRSRGGAMGRPPGTSTAA